MICFPENWTNDPWFKSECDRNEEIIINLVYENSSRLFEKCSKRN